MAAQIQRPVKAQQCKAVESLHLPYMRRARKKGLTDDVSRGLSRAWLSVCSLGPASCARDRQEALLSPHLGTVLGQVFGAYELGLVQGVFEWLRFLNSQSRPGAQRIMEAVMLQMRKGTMEELLATAEVHSVTSL